MIKTEKKMLTQRMKLKSQSLSAPEVEARTGSQKVLAGSARSECHIIFCSNKLGSICHQSANIAPSMRHRRSASPPPCEPEKHSSPPPHPPRAPGRPQDDCGPRLSPPPSVILVRG